MPLEPMQPAVPGTVADPEEYNKVVRNVTDTYRRANAVTVIGTWANGDSATPIATPFSANTVLCTIPLPDPGFPYLVRVYWFQPISWSDAGYGYARARLDDPDVGAMMCEVDTSTIPNGWSPAQIPGALYDVPLTGARTVYITAGASVSGASARGVRRGCHVEMLPVDDE